MNVSEVLNRLTKHRENQGKFVKHCLSIGRDDLAQKMLFCGSWILFKEFQQTGATRIKSANFCKKFLVCPCCAVRRASKLIEGYAKKVDQVQKETPGLIPVMITITVKNGDDLAERLGHLEDSFSRMKEHTRKAKSNPAKNLPIEWNKVAGSVAAYEITNEGKGWHPHIHVFSLISAYIDHSKLSAEWERFTGDSKIVGITKCKNANIVAALCECLKYASKTSTMSYDHRLHVYDEISGKRWVNPSGVLRGVKVGVLDEDEDGEEVGPFRFMIARWLFASMKWDISAADSNSLIIERPARSVAPLDGLPSPLVS